MSVKQEIEELVTAMKEPGAISNEAPGSETQQKWFNRIMGEGMFVSILLLGIGTQQAVIKITAARVSEVTQLENRAAKAVVSVNAATERLKAIEAQIESAQSGAAAKAELTARQQRMVDSGIKTREQKLVDLGSEIEIASKKVAALEEELTANDARLASLKEAVAGEEEHLASLKASAPAPVVPAEGLMAKVKGWLK
jgi:hypothetical protein